MALTVSYIGARGDHLPLGGIERQRRSTSTSSIRSTWRSARRRSAPQLPNPFFGNPTCRPSLVDAGDADARAAAAAVPAVRQRQRAAGHRRRRTATTPASSSGRKRLAHGWGGRFSYTYSVLKDNQFGETNFYSTVGGTAAEQLQLHPGGAGVRGGRSSSPPPATTRAPSTATACSTCRTASSSRRWSSCRSARARSTRATAASADAHRRRLDDRRRSHLQSGLPAERRSRATRTRILGGGTSARPNITPGVDLATPGSYEDRLASADHPTATWINPAAFSLAPFGTLRQRAAHDHRSAHADAVQHRRQLPEELRVWAAASRRRSRSRS